MKAISKKRANLAMSSATQAMQEPFFGKQGGEGFFTRTKQSNAPLIQAKLAINQPGDEYEQEADRMADRVVQQEGEHNVARKMEIEKINNDPGDKYLRMRMKYAHLSGMEFHNKFKDKRWYKKYMEHYVSPATNWDVKQKKKQMPVKKSFDSPGSGSVSKEEIIDLGQPAGILVIEYDMYEIPDRLRIEDAGSGRRIFDTRRKVKGKNKNKIEKKFNLNGGTKIKLLINHKDDTKDSDFKYKIQVMDDPDFSDSFYNIENQYPDPK